MASDSEKSGGFSPLRFFVTKWVDFFTSPICLIIFCISAFALFKIIGWWRNKKQKPPEMQLPRMKKRDMKIDELKKFDGTGEDGRICIAVNGKIFDVTRGKEFYGPGGPYSVFAGRDASRALSRFSVSQSAIKDDYDDLSDLTSAEMNRIIEWELQLTEKYDQIGRLLKPGQEPGDYTDSEDECEEKKDEKVKTQ